MDVLERTKKAFAGSVLPPFCDGVHCFTASEAKNFRDEYHTMVEIGLDPKSDWGEIRNGEKLYWGKSLSQWLVLAKDKDRRVRLYAARTFGAMGVGQ